MARKYRITPRAKADMRSIWEYSAEVWSVNQAERYIQALFERFEFLASRPELGKHRPDIAEGYYCFRQSSHIVFYQISDAFIDIIGILHQHKPLAWPISKI